MLLTMRCRYNEMASYMKTLDSNHMVHSPLKGSPLEMYQISCFCSMTAILLASLDHLGGSAEFHVDGCQRASQAGSH